VRIPDQSGRLAIVTGPNRARTVLLEKPALGAQAQRRGGRAFLARDLAAVAAIVVAEAGKG